MQLSQRLKVGVCYAHLPSTRITVDDRHCRLYSWHYSPSQRTSGLSIIARTDAAATTLGDSIQRTAAYQAAGADAICLVGVDDFKHLEALTKHLTLPIILITYGNLEFNDPERLSEAHVRVVVPGHRPYLANIKAAYDALRRDCGQESQDLSIQQLLSKYTLSQSYSEWEWVSTYLKAGLDGH